MRGEIEGEVLQLDDGRTEGRKEKESLRQKVREGKRRRKEREETVCLLEKSSSFLPFLTRSVIADCYPPSPLRFFSSTHTVCGN